jgi:uncharacterized protein
MAPILPVPDADSLPFWKAARQGRLLLPHGARSGRPHFYPRSVEPGTGDPVEWRQASGRGTVYSYTVVHRTPDPSFEPLLPYIVALVELDEGPRMLGILETDGAAPVRIGMAVEAAFAPAGDSVALTRFRPAPAGRSPAAHHPRGGPS